MQKELEAIIGDPLIYVESNFEKRFHALDQLEDLLHTFASDKDSLRKGAENLKTELEEIDHILFSRLRAKIRLGNYTPWEFRKMVDTYISLDLADNRNQEKAGYDELDAFINGLFPDLALPEQTVSLEPEMVYFQKTPARVVFELVANCPFAENDVFFDLGSGLGQVSILVNLLTGVKVTGVEMEPAFCTYALSLALSLNLSEVTFIHVDARKADYSAGTVFFLYTPFQGRMLQEVLDLLQLESLNRKIKLISYGPCTEHIARQSWLKPITSGAVDTYKLHIFSS